VHDPLRRALTKHETEHAVIRRDEAVPPALGGQGAAHGADAGIDDDQEHRVRREISI
jgi:hypothetical protein